MRRFKKFNAVITAVALSAAMLISTPVLADHSDWIDGDTPKNILNRVVTTDGNIIRPTVRTNFHATSVKALIPTSPKAEIDAATGVDKSIYSDASSFVYSDNNVEYGANAKAVLKKAMADVGATEIATITLNLTKYEGKAYKLVPQTENKIEFMNTIPKKFRNIGWDYAYIVVKGDGTYEYLADLDNDPITLTFKTNYFAANSLYALVYGPHGAFDAYKPQPAALPAAQ